MEEMMFSKGFKTKEEYDTYNAYNWLFLKAVKDAISIFDDTKNYTAVEVDKLADLVLTKITPYSSQCLEYMIAHNENFKGGKNNDR